MIRSSIATRWRIALGLLSAVVLLAAYSWLAQRQKQENPEDTTIPTWSQLKDGVVRAIEVNDWDEERWIVVDSIATVYRLFMGMLIGVTAAVVLGLLMGCFPIIESTCSPPLAFLANIPGTAALAVFFVLVGTDTEMYIAMVAFGVMPSLALTVHLAVRGVPDELAHKAYTLGASHPEVIWNVIVRHILPKLIDSIRLQIGPAMVYLIAAEMLVGDVGFGFRIRLQQKKLDMAVVYFYLAMLAAFGFSINSLLIRVQRFMCPWHEPTRR